MKKNKIAIILMCICLVAFGEASLCEKTPIMADVNYSKAHDSEKQDVQRALKAFSYIEAGITTEGFWNQLLVNGEEKYFKSEYDIHGSIPGGVAVFTFHYSDYVNIVLKSTSLESKEILAAVGLTETKREESQHGDVMVPDGTKRYPVEISTETPQIDEQVLIECLLRQPVAHASIEIELPVQTANKDAKGTVPLTPIVSFD